MKRGLTLVAKGSVGLVGLAALAVCVILVPEIAREDAVSHPQSAHLSLLFILGAYAIATPFFIALYQTFKLIRLVEQDKAFSAPAVTILKRIKDCAIATAILIALAAATTVTLARIIDPTEEAAPFLSLGLIVSFAVSTVAACMSVLQRLWQQAIAMKSDNDATV